MGRPMTKRRLRAAEPARVQAELAVMMTTGLHAAGELRGLGLDELADALCGVLDLLSPIHAGIAGRTVAPAPAADSVSKAADESVIRLLRSDAGSWRLLTDVAMFDDTPDPAVTAKRRHMAARYRLLADRARGIFAEADRIAADTAPES